MSFLSSLFGGGNSGNQVSPAASGVPVQTSCYGKPVPLCYGATRVAGNILELENFTSVAVNSGGGGGGGGSGGGGGCFAGCTKVDTPYGKLRIGGLHIGDIVYSYDPKTGERVTGTIATIWKHDVANDTHDKMVRVYFRRGIVGRTAKYLSDNLRKKLYRKSDSINPTDKHFLWDWSSIDRKKEAQQFKVGDSLVHREFGRVWVVGVEKETDEEFVFNLNVLPHHNFYANGILAHNGLGGASGKGGSSSYNYFIDVAVGISEGPITGYFAEWQGNTLTSVAADGWTVFDGTYPQSPWKTEAYTGLSYVAKLQYALGSSANLPQWNFEIEGFFYGSAAAANYGGNGCLVGGDADPSLVINHFLTDPTVGAGFPANRLGELVTEDEAYTIPASGPYTITVTEAADYDFNINVVDWLGNLYTPVSGSPDAGEYSFDPTTGIYTFNSANAGTPIRIRYAANVGLPTMQAWSIAAGLWVSPCYDSQTQTSSMVDDLCTACYLSAVWSSGSLKFVPRSTVAVTANGYSYTPNTTPLFSLGDDDFLPNVNVTGASNAGTNNDPLIVSRSRASDQINDITVEFLDRSNQYAPSIAEYTDQANIDAFGKRKPSSTTLHLLCDANAANTSARFQMQDQYIRNTYSFTTDMRFSLLDPMDIIEVTDEQQGIVNQAVRITEITENDDGTLSFVAEEYPVSNGAPASYSFATGAGYTVDYEESAGSVNDPILVALPIQFAGVQGLAIGVGLSNSSPIFGGAQVWISTDGGDTYTRRLPDIKLPARMGVTVGDFPIGSDPDTSDSLEINFAESPTSEFTPSPTTAANQNATLSLVRGANGDEYIATSNVSLTSANHYTFDTYIRRGQQSTLIVDHPSGSPFLSMDQAVYQVPYQANQIGTTLTLKFLSFNVWEGGLQTLDDVTAYSITLPEPPAPPDVTGFGVQQQGNAVALSWQAVNYPSVGLAGYILAYAPMGSTNWSDFQILSEIAAGTEVTTVEVAPGSYTFGIRAANLAYSAGSNVGLSPDIATADLVVVNENEVIYSSDEAPAWSGTLVNLVEHYTGVLTPTSSVPSSDYEALSPPSAPTFSQASSGALLARTYYATVTYVDKTGETVASSESGPYAVLALNLASIAAPSSPPAQASGWNIYASTTSGTETLQNTMALSLSSNWTEPSTGLTNTGASSPTLNTTGWQTFDDFVPSPNATASYTTNTIDTGYNDTLRISFASNTALGPGEAGPECTVAYALDYWLTGQSDPDVFYPWMIGTEEIRYIRGQLNLSGVVEGNVPYIADFVPRVDSSPVIEQSASATVIAGGGTLITFSTRFHFVPLITASVLGSSGLYYTIDNPTDTGFTAHIFNSAGSDVGGTLQNWQAIGE